MVTTEDQRKVACLDRGGDGAGGARGAVSDGVKLAAGVTRCRRRRNRRDPRHAAASRCELIGNANCLEHAGTPGAAGFGCADTAGNPDDGDVAQRWMRITQRGLWMAQRRR